VGAEKLEGRWPRKAAVYGLSAALRRFIEAVGAGAGSGVRGGGVGGLGLFVRGLAHRLKD